MTLDLSTVPTEYRGGRWRLPSMWHEPEAVVTCGDGGWVWWADGKMGNAPSYEAACAAAVASLDAGGGR